ncbi:MAG: dTMP kinase [Thermoprotei archaeon]|nr:MAG: dTMP kinase [Thermoprotei archaeon]RLE98122.1 MAG: dTMP kinase [Thermoprotei archaeon]
MIFVAFEGIDGAGLTTHARLTERYLESRGIKTILTKEPTDGLIGGLIRACLRGEWRTDPMTLQLLFAADRSHHVHSLIIPALRSGKAVVSDRYLFSSLAYGSLDLDYEWLKEINSRFPLPHVTFILDLEPLEALRRIREDRFALELFEELEKLERVRRAYMRIAREYRNVFVVKTDDEIEEVQGRIEEILEEALNKLLREKRQS